MDPAALRGSFAAVAEYGDEVPLYFYSYLFLRNPSLRTMFPPSMAAQRDRLVGALLDAVTAVDDPDRLVPYLQHLGRDHRKYRVIGDHYPAVGEALLATLAHFLGARWTPEIAAMWSEAYAVISGLMIEAADATGGAPAWWEAEVLAHERRGIDVAVVTVRPDRPLPYLPGQSLSVHTNLRPRIWRYYSPANAPRPDGTIEFHVRAVDGGRVSSALVHSLAAGDVLQLGPAAGAITLDAHSQHDVLMIAGGTGLAPLRAMVEQVARGQAAPRQIRLYVEARTEPELYDLEGLELLARTYPWLSVVPTAVTGPIRRAQPGLAVDHVLRASRGDFPEIYVCGRQAMVDHTRRRLVEAGVHPERIRLETFGYRVGPARRGPGLVAMPEQTAPAEGDRSEC